jgi:sialate O-acetylesterase
MQEGIKSIRLGHLMAFCFLIIANLFVCKAYADVKLPRIFSDNMLLQRETPVKVWGWADPGERVRVQIGNQTKSVRTDRSGNWSVTLDPLKAGGPIEMAVQGKNTIRLTNILVGDVWLGSGQSNMEWPVSQSADAEEEISLANHSNIRLFTVPRYLAGKPVDDIESGEWHVCSPETVERFSAVGYYFARYLNRELDVPIGIINSSWGGTIAETWISHESISQHEDFAERMKQTPDFNLEKIQREAQIRLEAWTESIERNDLGKQLGWEKPGFDDSEWAKMDLPVLWEQAGLPDLDGVVWFRNEFFLDNNQAKETMVLNLGPIDDSDYTYVNGHLVGKTIDQYNANRRYEVPAKYVKEGRNVIAVRVVDTGGGGGIWGDENQLFYIAGTEKVSLAGLWKYAVGIKTDAPPQAGTGPNAFPTLLYNGMIYPIKSLSIRGSIWYQGESNAARAYQYQSLFPLLIQDWRQQFNNPGMPFFFVQLANFMQPDRTPTDSQWAELREAQTMTLSLPHTGMAVAIDIGEANDIHPRNKQDVGKRLALAALKVSYGKDIFHSGPMYKSMSKEGNKIRLNFTETGSGLMIDDKYGYLKGFAIAGEDRVFHWAKATLEGNQVVVFSDTVANPVAVRYAWGNNPDDANLYNIEGLPASPFRTDDWPGITQGRRQ